MELSSSPDPSSPSGTPFGVPRSSSPQRVLVTGHHGYIGSVLTPMLVAAGHRVTGLDSDFFAPCLLPGEVVEETVPSLVRDLRDVEPADLEGFDAVVHLAGLSNDPLGNLDSGLTEAINETASVRFARLAKEAGVKRFLFSSSCSTYGAAPGDDFLDETATFNPVTPYGVSKLRMEEALSAMADSSFSPTYLRNATAYGVSPRLRVDVVLNNLVGWAVTTGRIHLLSDGSPWRPIVHVEDISRAFLAVLDAPREAVHDEPFNVGRTDENYRIRELAEIVGEAVPEAEISFADDAGPDKRTYRVDCDKIRRALPAFEPRWTARRGAAELARAYRRAGLTEEQFKGARYVRLARIRQLRDADQLTPELTWVVEPSEAVLP